MQYMVWTVRQGIKSYEKHIKQMERYIEKFQYVYIWNWQKILHFTESGR